MVKGHSHIIVLKELGPGGGYWVSVCLHKAVMKRLIKMLLAAAVRLVRSRAHAGGWGWGPGAADGWSEHAKCHLV